MAASTARTLITLRQGPERVLLGMLVEVDKEIAGAEPHFVQLKWMTPPIPCDFSLSLSR